MRDLTSMEVAFVSGGKQEEGGDGEAPVTVSFWQRCWDAIYSYWNRSPCAQGGTATMRDGGSCTTLTEKDARAAIDILSAASALGDLDKSPSDLNAAAQGAVDNILKVKREQQEALDQAMQ